MNPKLGIAGIVAVSIIVILMASFETVSTGHVAVGTRFGKVTGDVLSEGLHLVNPILNWDHFDCLEQEVTFVGIKVPAEDQMKATMDVTVKGRFLASHAVTQRRETGTQNRVIAVHFQTISRGALRDAGRGIAKVEMFFEDSKIDDYEEAALAILQEGLGPKGYEITDVIVRDVSLPQVIAVAIDKKKQREQQVEEERAELARVALQAQQSVKQAEANLTAADLDAQAVRIKASAEAFAIDVVKQELTKQYIEFQIATRWDGALPKFTGGGVTPLIDFSALAAAN